MTKMLDRLGGLLETLLAVLLALMVVMVFGNVVLRYAFNSGISVSEELARWAFVWMTLLGAVLALKDNAHLGVDLLVKMLPRAGQKTCHLVTELIELGLGVLMLVGSWNLTVLNLHVAAPTSQLSVAIFYSAGLVFSVLSIAVLLSRLLQTLRGGTPGGSSGQPAVAKTE